MNTNISELINNMSEELQTLLKGQEAKLIGIQTGGMLVAGKLAEALNYKDEIGSLNISFYRDDFTSIGMHPEVSPSSLPFEVEGQTIILVDDVLFTGRTIRAALNEIFDYGRPARVILAILVERKARELPICADVCGITLQGDQAIKLLENGTNLELKIDE